MSINKNILKLVFSSLSKQLRVKEDFIVEVYDEANSWSFISKLAQLYEGVFTELIVIRLNEPEIHGTISNLSQATRIDFSHDLKIITREQKFLFLTVAEIRNDYIHNISNVSVELKHYLSTLKAERQKEIFGRFKHFIKNKKVTRESFIEDCKYHIFNECALQALDVYGKMYALQAERKHRKFRAEMSEKLLPPRAEDSLFFDDKIQVMDYVEKARTCLKNNDIL
jgi:hypothetical protein